MKLSKVEAAARQLDAAIRLHFAAADVCAVHTLAAAAETILRDLVNRYGGTSWFELGAQANRPMSRKAYKDLFNRTQNFLKHADRDPDAEIEFNEFENDGILLVATIDYGELWRIRGNLPMDVLPMSPAAEFCQLWCLAANPKWGAMLPAIWPAIQRQLPDLAGWPRFEQLAFGGTVLKRLPASNPDWEAVFVAVAEATRNAARK